MTTLDSFLRWLEEEAKDEKTVAAYKTAVSQFCKWYIDSTGSEDLNSVKPSDVKEYLRYLKHTMNRKQATINKATASLKTFFSYLTELGSINDNPMTRIKIQKVQLSNNVGEKSVIKWLTKEEQDKFIDHVNFEKNELKRIRNLAIVDVMLYSGLRVAEVEALKVEDINVNGDITITIREGKRGRYSSVTMIQKYSKNLRNWLKLRNALDDEIYLHSPYLFVSERSGQLRTRGIQVMLNKYAASASMDNIFPHRFRHSFCKNLANAGVSIETICKLARHESIQTTAIYIDPSHHELLRALERM
ncbi:tyrosine-type recombinase/integrase [Paenibacillus alvei]|uniref:tyrosine-type recombinase/integrase n=1 Tax=Paenibacillus alvei TaxID=44250 RepID=UPI0013DABF96|nr:tyrosine-type recombinase/integrase [Paenibacillus alvei]NEZ42875.1 tyrosine-type recombinase/integrase [Paenibacillus alvei]